MLSSLDIQSLGEYKRRLKNGFLLFVESLNEVLNDITALEVNTIIADDYLSTLMS